MYDLFMSMTYSYRRGVIHRDLKAANLLIDEYDVRCLPLT